MKDWTGNGNSIFKILGASNHTDKERETDDFYATSPRAIDALLEYADLHLPHKIWEPSCGTGCLSLRLTERGYDVTSTDLIDRGFGTGGINFFEQRQMPDGCQCIVTNPPYKYATEYVRHSLRLLPDGGWLCLFLKTTFAEGQERYREIFSPTPPILVLQCVERVLCAKNADFEGMQAGGGSAVSYAWWIWQKGYAGPTTLDWINHPKPSLNPNVTQLSLF